MRKAFRAKRKAENVKKALIELFASQSEQPSKVLNNL